MATTLAWFEAANGLGTQGHLKPSELYGTGVTEVFLYASGGQTTPEYLQLFNYIKDCTAAAMVPGSTQAPIKFYPLIPHVVWTAGTPDQVVQEAKNFMADFLGVLRDFLNPLGLELSDVIAGCWIADEPRVDSVPRGGMRIDPEILKRVVNETPGLLGTKRVLTFGADFLWNFQGAPGNEPYGEAINPATAEPFKFLNSAPDETLLADLWLLFAYPVVDSVPAGGELVSVIPAGPYTCDLDSRFLAYQQLLDVVNAVNIVQPGKLQIGFVVQAYAKPEDRTSLPTIGEAAYMAYRAVLARGRVSDARAGTVLAYYSRYFLNGTTVSPFNSILASFASNSPILDPNNDGGVDLDITGSTNTPRDPSLDPPSITLTEVAVDLGAGPVVIWTGSQTVQLAVTTQLPLNNGGWALFTPPSPTALIPLPTVTLTTDSTIIVKYEKDATTVGLSLDFQVTSISSGIVFGRVREFWPQDRIPTIDPDETSTDLALFWRIPWSGQVTQERHISYNSYMQNGLGIPPSALTEATIDALFLTAVPLTLSGQDCHVGTGEWGNTRLFNRYLAQLRVRQNSSVFQTAPPRKPVYGHNYGISFSVREVAPNDLRVYVMNNSPLSHAGPLAITIDRPHTTVIPTPAPIFSTSELAGVGAGQSTGASISVSSPLAGPVIDAAIGGIIGPYDILVFQLTCT